MPSTMQPRSRKCSSLFWYAVVDIYFFCFFLHTFINFFSIDVMIETSRFCAWCPSCPQYKHMVDVNICEWLVYMKLNRVFLINENKEKTGNCVLDFSYFLLFFSTSSFRDRCCHGLDQLKMLEIIMKILGIFRLTFKFFYGWFKAS